jgi:MFS family permease
MDIRRKVHLINFGRKLTVNAAFFLAPLYFLKLGFSGWQIGLIVSMMAFAPLVVSFPTGLVNDRFSIKHVIRASLLAQAAAFLVVGRAGHFPLIAAAYLVLGMCNNVLDVSLNSLYYKDPDEENLNLKYSRLAFWLNLGMAVGTALGGLLAYLTGFPLLFITFAFLSLALLPAARGLGPERFEVISWRDYRRGLFRRKTLLFCLMLFILTLHWGLEGTIYSPFLKEAFGLNLLKLSLYISLALCLTAAASYSIGFLRFDSRRNSRLFTAALFLSGAGLVLMTFRPLGLSFAGRLIHEAGDGLLAATVTLTISRLFEKRSIGGSAGLLVAVYTLGNVVGAQVLAPLGFKLGLAVPFLLVGGLLVADSLFSYYVFRRVEY